MTAISWNEVQDRASDFASKWTGETYEKGESQSFWSDFLAVYGIDRRRHGAYFEYAIKKGSGSQGFIDMFWPGKLLAEQKSGGKDLKKAGVQAYDYLETMPDHDLPEAIVVSDFASFQLIDLATREKIEFSLEEFPRYVRLFGFLINQKSKSVPEENPVNKQAAEAMASLHNQLKNDNYTGHDLEVLLVRLVFCMFADDSGIFDHNILQSYLINRTQNDGTDLGSRLIQVFQTLNTPIEQRQKSLDEDIASLPYVNGGLFAEQIQTPSFNSLMRQELLQAMTLDWSKVSPAIFGSMFQAVMDKMQRRNLGAHYTSERNILRVIKPLFLDDLYIEFAKIMRSGTHKYKNLRAFQEKLSSLKFLDPACGAGNFLVITYRELRILEHKVVAVLAKGEQTIDMFATAGQGVSVLKVNVDQMYGIEIEEFPSLIAQTALWLTDHQMNIEYSKQSGITYKRLPLKHSAKVFNQNALVLDWTDVVNPADLNYILGNPPFNGSKMMTSQMRINLEAQFNGYKGVRVLDFVSAWYAKAVSMMKLNPNIESALVSTNSIVQGEQVPILWKYMFENGVFINFAHRSFKWTNDAKGSAAVHCVIIGFSLKDKREKRIFEYPHIKGDPIELQATTINAYLVDARSVFVENRTKPICKVPNMVSGNKPIDNGEYLFTRTEKNDFIKLEPLSEPLFKRWLGGFEFLNNVERWCLYTKNADLSTLRKMPAVLARINAVRTYRAASQSLPTKRLADFPRDFHTTFVSTNSYIALPEVSSERRKYIPIAFLDDSYLCSNKLRIIDRATLYHFGVLTSRMHMSWVRVVSGRLKSDYQYSKNIVYNNYIWPDVTENQVAGIEELVKGVINARKEFSDATLADLYDPLTMPTQLLKAHQALDRAVDKLYSKNAFNTDDERVALLFEKYFELSQ